MRLDMQREHEKARRKGSAFRTILATIWLAICFAIAYFISEWLITTGVMDYGFFYNRLFVPRWVPEWGVRVGFMIVMVTIMQFFVFIGFAFTSPSGRRRPGKPTLGTTNPDPFDNKYDYH